MAGHITSGSSSVIVGQTVNVQATLDLAPPIPRDQGALDEMTVAGSPYNPNTQQFLQVNGLTATASIELAQRGTKTSAFWNFIYNIHPTQQLFDANKGSRFFIHVIDYISTGFDMRVAELEWGYDPATNQGLVQVYNLSGVAGEYRQTGYIPSAKQFQIQHFGGAFYIAYDGSFIASILEDSSWVGPYKIKYGYYKLGGQPQSVSWPAGHPALGVYSNFIFSEAQLVGAGQWPPFEPTWTAIALNASDVQIGTTVYNPTSVGYTSDIPVASFTVPNVSGIAKFRIRGKFHFLNSSTLGWPYLDIPVSGGTAPPLTVSGSNPVTLEPGATYTVVANYPTSELTFLAIGGGSFGTGATANVYTAPLDHGSSATYQFKVTRAAENVTIGVNVPLRLTPATVSMIGGTTQLFTANADVTSWSVTGGSLSGSGTRTRTYTAPATLGTFNINTTAVTGGATTTAAITVTSTGTTPTTGLRLEPSAGYSVSLNATPVVKMIGDISPSLWATLNNVAIDQANGNLRIQSNTSTAEATLAQAVDAVAGATASIFEWKFNPTMQASPGDLPQHIWLLVNDAGLYRVRIIFSYIGTGEQWDVAVYSQTGGELVRQNFTRTDTSGIRVEIDTTSGGQTVTVKFRASSAGAFTTIAAPTFAQPQSNLPTYFLYVFNPSITTQSNGAVVIEKPTLVQGFVRWYPPSWVASRVDGSGNVLGSYSVTPGEDAIYTSGSRARTAAVFCNAVGTARVRANYPSGVASQNDVFITITSSGTALAVTTPASGVTTDLAPGATLTVEANDAPSALTYSCPGGTFGSTAGTKNIFTAGATAGFYTLTVSRGSEVVTRTIRVLMRVTPSTQSIAVSSSAFLDINTATSISYSATGGTVSLVSISGGVTRLLYSSPAVAATYTVNVTSSINNASATVTVIASGTTPIVISNTEPINVEPGSFAVISTNYPPSEVTYSATGGAFRTGAQKHYWDAPQQAGPYTITVSHATGGVDTAAAVVPLRLSPKNPSAVIQGGQIQFSANYPTLTWSISSAGGGAISSTGLWTAGATAGTYTVTANANIGGTIYTDTTTVTISGAALVLNVPSAVTLAPAGTLTITANYPTGELTFSATGGSFTGNVYTAPNDRGTYTITVARAGQTSIVTVTVPLTISPSTISMAQSTTQVFTVNADIVNFATTGWVATGGTLSSQAIRTVTYTAGATAGTYTVSGTTASGTAVAQVTNTGTASVPIVINGPALIFMEPGSTVNITTNKPVGTYSLTATGGTFQGNQYRAPQTGGAYTITATDTSGSGGGSDTLAVEVPLRISPANPTIPPGGSQQFTINYPINEVSWSTSPASLINATGGWSAPFTPGVYTIRAVTPIGEATTAATVQVIELVVYGPDQLTLEPGGRYTVFANISGRALTFTAFGGSFDLYTYVAPETAGEYYFTVTYQGQVDRTDVTVPVRISPKEVRLESGESFQFTINAPSATWSVTPASQGSITQTGFYTAPTTGGTFAKVTATTPSGSDTATVIFLDEFPYQPTYAYGGERARDVIIVELEDRSRKGRVKGAMLMHYELKFQRREREELDAVMAFYEDRWPNLPFLFNDLKLRGFVPVIFDSAVRFEINGTCEYSYSFRLVELDQGG